MKRLSLLIAVFLLSAGMLFGAPVQEETEQEKEIVLAAPRDIVPGEGDFFFATSMVKVWEPLVGVNEEWMPVPALAESWEHNNDATVWTFRLRKGVTFHDGVEFDADVVMKNFDRYRAVDPGKSKFYSFTIERFYPGFEKIEKVDDYTVRLTFGKSMPTLPFFMSNFGSAMFSPDCFDSEGNFTKTAAGTGPFKVVEHVLDRYAVLERYDGYWGEPARAEQIRIRVIPDGNTRFSALKAEEIMGVLDIGAIQPNLAKQLVKEERFKDSVAKSSIIHYISPSGTKFPFNDVRMRQAVSLIIDRKLIAEEFYSGYVTPAPHILNYSSPFYKDMPIEHDPQKARRLAKEVMGDRRITMDLVLPAPFTGKYPYKEQAEYLQSVVSELGVDLKIKMLEWGAFREAQRNGEYGLGMQIQGLPSGEPFAIFNSFMRSNSGQNKSYGLGYSNPRVDRLLDEVASTVDMDRRAEIYETLQEIAAEEYPFIPVVNDSTVVVYNTKLEGYNAEIYGVTVDKIRWAD
jgi:peptide/nickel transport system substrate-binding protein